MNQKKLSPKFTPLKQSWHVRTCNEVLNTVVLVSEDMFWERLHGSGFGLKTITLTSAPLIKVGNTIGLWLEAQSNITLKVYCSSFKQT